MAERTSKSKLSKEKRDIQAKPSPYEILNVSPTANIDEIKKAHKLLTRKWHPDKNLNNKQQADEMIKQINNAYDILVDEEQRAIYDRDGYKGLEKAKEETQAEQHQHPFQEVFERSNNVEVAMTLEELYHDTEKEIEFTRTNLCLICQGSGCSKLVLCTTCHGQGATLRQMGPTFVPMKCPKCQGTRKDISSVNCQSCVGQGHTEEQFKMKVLIPKGSHTGQRISTSRQGDMLPNPENKIKRAMVNCIIREIEHDTFKRGIPINELHINSPNDLRYDLKITFAESLFGFDRVIRLIDGRNFDLSINRSTVNGDIFCLDGLGMPDSNDDTYGDLLIYIQVDKPDLSYEQRNKIYQILSNTTTDLPDRNYETKYSTYTEYVNKKTQLLEHVRAGQSNIDVAPACTQQ